MMLTRLARGISQKVLPLGRRTAIRSFAAGGDDSNPWEEMHAEMAALKPPIEIHGPYAGYANSAFVKGSDAKALDAIENDLKAVAALMDDAATVQYFKDPSVDVGEKQKAIDTLVKEGGLHEVSGAILSIVNDDNDMANIAAVSDDFGQLMAAHRGEVRATVTSAEPLGASDTKAVTAALTKRLKKGQKLVLEKAVDPKIMGGLLVEIGNEFADLSVRSSVEDINQALRT